MPPPTADSPLKAVGIMQMWTARIIFLSSLQVVIAIIIMAASSHCAFGPHHLFP